MNKKVKRYIKEWNKDIGHAITTQLMLQKVKDIKRFRDQGVTPYQLWGKS